MLRTLVDFFLGLKNVITSLIEFVIGFISDLVYVVRLCGSFVLKIPTFFSWLPDVAITLIITIFGIVVIYKVIGREG